MEEIDDDFCDNCGSTCEDCGAEIFCEECGTPYDTEQHPCSLEQDVVTY